jgi:L,D-peptidoglycan transpeptidase YkuD (ErfK/YbiS/YcfS/YnhG family)
VSFRDGGWQARFGEHRWSCAVGRGGVRADKVEGDDATPAGCWPIRRILYRADRLQPPTTVFPSEPLQPHDGWCDAPGDPRYNKLVRLPYSGSHERLWRDDEIYDCIVVLGHNDDPVRSGAGSAIFLHVARGDLAATEGCLALHRADLMAFLRAAAPSSRVCVAAP